MIYGEDAAGRFGYDWHIADQRAPGDVAVGGGEDLVTGSCVDQSATVVGVASQSHGQ